MTTSTRSINFTFTGQLGSTYSLPAAQNTVSPGSIGAPFTLAAGDTTFGVPIAAGVSVPTALTIYKPPGNTAQIKIKGSAGDTGIKLHPTDPDSISFDPTQTTFILNASAPVNGMQLIWS